MTNIQLDLSGITSYVQETELPGMQRMAEMAKEMLLSKSGAGNDYLGWLDLPINYDKEEFRRIQEAARKIQSDSDVLLVIGIGGSYLGAKAAIHFLNHPFCELLQKEERKAPLILFAGNNMSAAYIRGIQDIIRGKQLSVNVISKSGTTTESAIAFRIFQEHMEAQYGKEEAAHRIYVTTDKREGALKKIADIEGYETFVIPDDIGGRFSVLTAVGLLPIAASGIAIEQLMEGAAAERSLLQQQSYEENAAMQYAAARNILYRKGKRMELLVNYEPTLHDLAEWWKQLYAESEGKDQKGIYPASADFTTDLHSLGQFIQEGSRNLYETVLSIETPKTDFMLKEKMNDLDGLNYLAGKTMNFVNCCARNGTREAHIQGGVPNLMIQIPEQNAFYLGQLFYFFEFACGISGYLNGINPFNQPGVEFYKSSMFALLGKDEETKLN